MYDDVPRDRNQTVSTYPNGPPSVDDLNRVHHEMHERDGISNGAGPQHDNPDIEAPEDQGYEHNGHGDPYYNHNAPPHQEYSNVHDHRDGGLGLSPDDIAIAPSLNSVLKECHNNQSSIRSTADGEGILQYGKFEYHRVC